jgi:hypothetical protein
MLRDDVVLALQHGGPVDLDLAGDIDAVLLGVLEMVVDLGVEEQRFGRNATPQQAGAAELFVVVDERGLQAVLSGANGGGVSGGASAEDRNVVDRVFPCLCQGLSVPEC